MKLPTAQSEHLGNPAIVDTTVAKAWSYGELRREVERLARNLQLSYKGLGFLFCHCDFASIQAYLACLSAGHAVCLLDGTATPPLKQQLIKIYRPDLVLESARGSTETGPFEPDSPEASAGQPYRPQAGGPPGVRVWKAVKEADSPVHPSLSVLLSTSGTTGSPKLVRLSRQNVEANAESIRQYLAIEPGERAIGSLPMHYSYGLSVLNSHLISGACVVLTELSIIWPEFWKTFDEQGCTSFAGVPYSYEILTRIGMERMPLPTLRTMTQAGGKMDPALIRRFDLVMKKRGGRLIVMYGQTEATARISYLPERYLPDKAGSVGVTIPGGRLEVDDNGTLTSRPHVRGEIVYSGPNVMLGYATCRTDLAEGDHLGGTLRTGDVGYFDEDGLLYITGRTKRFSKIFGLRINLDEVEAKLRERGPVAAVGSDEKIVLHCEFGDHKEFEAMRRELAKLYGINGQAFEFRRIASLPLTSSGKVDYQAFQKVDLG
jgi:long-chain acyl-CoA synthetase